MAAANLNAVRLGHVTHHHAPALSTASTLMVCRLRTSQRGILNATAFLTDCTKLMASGVARTFANAVGPASYMYGLP
jgi:hypothetical protein